MSSGDQIITKAAEEMLDRAFPPAAEGLTAATRLEGLGTARLLLGGAAGGEGRWATGLDGRIATRIGGDGTG